MERVSGIASLDNSGCDGGITKRLPATTLMALIDLDAIDFSMAVLAGRRIGAVMPDAAQDGPISDPARVIGR
jgi:hypothetical protein